MGFSSVLSFAHQLLSKKVHPGDRTIDATVGNGNDTLFLLKQVQSKGKVYGFDIQKEALDNTLARLAQAEIGNLDNVQLFQQSHADMERFIPEVDHGNISAVTFNFGYLPGGSHPHIVTLPETSLQALQASIRLLKPGGMITAVIYVGHPGGWDEAKLIESWAAKLPRDTADVIRYSFLNRAESPYVIAIEKK